MMILGFAVEFALCSRDSRAAFAISSGVGGGSWERAGAASVTARSAIAKDGAHEPLNVCHPKGFRGDLLSVEMSILTSQDQ